MVLALELQDCILDVPRLVSLYEKKDPVFIEKLKQWFLDCEAILQRYNKPQVAQIATLRGEIIAGTRGYIDPFFQINNETSKRKASLALAMFCLKRAEELLTEIVRPFNAQQEEAKGLLRQILLVAVQNKLLDSFWNNYNGQIVQIQSLWQQLLLYEDIKHGLNQVRSLIPAPFAWQIMNEILTDWQKDLA